MRAVIRRTGVLACLGYLIVGVVVLGPSLRPGHTLVPADLVTAVQPYNQAAGGFHAQNPNVSDATPYPIGCCVSTSIFRIAPGAKC